MNNDLQPLVNVICFGFLLLLVVVLFAGHENDKRLLNNYLKEQGQQQVK